MQILFTGLSLVQWACSTDFEASDAPLVIVQTSVASDPDTHEVSVRPKFVVDFSASMDLSRVHAGAVAVLAWRPGEACIRRCDKGSCVAGRCWRDSLKPAQLREFGRGKNTAGEDIHIELQEGSYGHASRMVIQPTKVLNPHQIYELVLGTALGSSDAALISSSADQDDIAFRKRVMTGAKGTAGPELELRVPGVGTENVPVDLGWIQTEFSGPIDLKEADHLTMVSDDGEFIRLGGAQVCAAEQKNCVQWNLETALRANTSYKVVSGTVRGRDGQPMQIARPLQWFHSAKGSAGPLPAQQSMQVWNRGRCIYASLPSVEPLLLGLEAWGKTASFFAPRGGAVGLPVPRLFVHEDWIEARSRVQNLAGMEVEWSWTVDKDPFFSMNLPQFAITEVLANPIGSDPQGEFVEILRLPDLKPHRSDDPGNDVTGEIHSGLYLSDQPWDEIVQALQEGERLGDRLPDFRLDVGKIVVVVGPDYIGRDNESWPKRYEEEVTWIRLDSTLGSGGLANRGEAITLYRLDPPALLASVPAEVSVHFGGQEGQSITIRDADACDFVRNWRAHPDASSDPGRITPN